MWRGNQLGRWVSTNVLLEIVGETRYSFCAVEETRPLGDTNVLLLSKISNSSLEVSSEAKREYHQGFRLCSKKRWKFSVDPTASNKWLFRRVAAEGGGEKLNSKQSCSTCIGG